MRQCISGIGIEFSVAKHVRADIAAAAKRIAEEINFIVEQFPFILVPSQNRVAFFDEAVMTSD
jgi:hypothetical protein